MPKKVKVSGHFRTTATGKRVHVRQQVRSSPNNTPKKRNNTPKNTPKKRNNTPKNTPKKRNNTDLNLRIPPMGQRIQNQRTGFIAGHSSPEGAPRRWLLPPRAEP